MYKVSREVYILLYELYVLACMREPVQGEFYFGCWNAVIDDDSKDFETKENINYCGTVGCLAGGYLPLIDPSKYFFTPNGQFMVKEVIDTKAFESSLLYAKYFEVYQTIFNPKSQDHMNTTYGLNLVELNYLSKKEVVLDNLRKVLAAITYHDLYVVELKVYYEKEEVYYKGLLQRFNHTDRKPKPMTIEAFREWFKRYTRINIYKDSSEYRTSILNDFVSGTWYDLCKEV